MNTTPILANIAKHIALTSDEENYFLSLLREKSFNKKELILRESQRCEYINFVNSGTLRAYYLSNDVKETTVMFAIKDWWITDMNCFMNLQPAMLHIEALENSQVIQLSKNNLDKLFLEIPKFERFFRIIFQKAYIREQLRGIENLSLSAEERYQVFSNKYPQILKKVNQKQIASYLGITPEFLSSILSKSKK